jgi:hypothetical protein|tara:strand:- start:15219 stop:15488 length:270 start_codon:yes stop_codon:yes gene_type:complete
MEDTIMDNGLEIYSDVAIPDMAERKSYPFGKLSVGQCFIIDYEDRKQINSIRSSAYGWNKKQERDGTGREVIVRRIPDTESQVGIWRIS